MNFRESEIVDVFVSRGNIKVIKKLYCVTKNFFININLSLKQLSLNISKIKRLDITSHPLNFKNLYIDYIRGICLNTDKLYKYFDFCFRTNEHNVIKTIVKRNARQANIEFSHKWNADEKVYTKYNNLMQNYLSINLIYYSSDNSNMFGRLCSFLNTNKKITWDMSGETLTSICQNLIIKMDEKKIDSFISLDHRYHFYKDVFLEETIKSGNIVLFELIKNRFSPEIVIISCLKYGNFITESLFLHGSNTVNFYFVINDILLKTLEHVVNIIQDRLKTFGYKYASNLKIDFLEHLINIPNNQKLLIDILESEPKIENFYHIYNSASRNSTGDICTYAKIMQNYLYFPWQHSNCLCYIDRLVNYVNMGHLNINKDFLELIKNIHY